MTKFHELKAEHQRLLDQHDAGEDQAVLSSVVQKYIDQVRIDAEGISDPRDRDQLRAYLRFWGAYVYDQTGTYPETSLRPSLQVEAAPRFFWDRWNRRWIYGGVVGLILILAIFGLMMLGTLSGELPPDVSPSATTAQKTWEAVENATPVPRTKTPVGEAESATDEVHAELPTLTKTVTQTPYSSPSPSATLTPFTAEEARTATAVAVLTKTPGISIETQLPETGGGGDFFERQQLIARVGDDLKSGWCTAGLLVVGGLPADGQPASDNGIPIWVQQAGEARIAMRAIISTNTESVSMNLTSGDSLEPGQYLLHMEHPTTTASDLIFTYDPGCRSRELVVAYQRVEAGSGLDEEPARNPDLALTWRLVTWGPEPQGSGGDPRWFAVFDLVGQGGDKNYIFWQADDYGYLEPLDGNRVIVRGRACESGRLIVGVTSAGEALTRELVVQAPYCPEP